MDGSQDASRAVWQRQISGEQRRQTPYRGAARREGAGLRALRRYRLPDVQPAHPARNALHRIESAAFDKTGISVNRP